MSTYTISTSANQGILQVEASQDLLTNYFQNNDLYVGLWYDTSFDPQESNTLNSFIYELTQADYSRIKIPKNDWVIDEIERRAKTNREYSLKPIQSSWNVSGYFICTSSDNSGVFIDLIKFQKEETLSPEQYLNIRPQIDIHGIEEINVVVRDSITFDYLADGTYVAGYLITIPAVGSVTYTI